MAELLVQFPPESMPWETKDLDALWERLEGSGLPSGALIGVEQADGYDIRYPPERAGELYVWF